MNRRYFTIKEANQMIPSLVTRFGRMLQLHARIRESYGRLDDQGFAPTEAEFELDPQGAGVEVTRERAELRALMQALKSDLDELHASGCVVKDVGSGLVDWYAQKDGRDVFLCWKLGEKSIGYWHELEAGFPGRRPVSELLRSD